MKIGEGNALFLADIQTNVTTDEIRNRWKAGKYGKPPEQWALDNLAFRGRR